MPKHVTPERFLEVWKDVWVNQDSELRDQWIHIWDNKDSFQTTVFILGNHEQKGFLEYVAAELREDPDLDVAAWKREFRRLDFTCFGRERVYGEPNDTYAPHLPLILEHENGDNVEEEMWKLCIFRSPLKVLVFYDWDECDIDPMRRFWLEDKLQRLWDIRRKFDATWEENPNTHYLLIVGDRKGPGCDTQWRYAIDYSTKPEVLTEPRC